MLAATRHAASLTGNSLNPTAVLSSSRRAGHAHPASSSLVHSSNGGSSSTVVQTHCSSQQHSRCCHLIPRAAGRGGRGGSSSSSSRRGGSGTSDGSSAWQDRLYSRGNDAGADAGSGAPGRDYASNPRPRQPPGKQGGRGSSSSSSRGADHSSSTRRAADSGSSGSSDFVVIKKADASGGAYIPTTQELQVQEETLDGAAYWDAALADFGEDEDEDEGEDELGGEDEWEDGGGGGGEEEDVEVEEVISLLRELAAGLEDEAEEGSEEGSEEGEEGVAAGREELGPRVWGAAGVQWRQAYLGGATQPPLTLGPLCVKQAAGKGRGLFTTAAVQAGEVLLVCCPVTLLYSEEGITPENEELAKHLAAVVAATAAAGSGSSGSSTGLAPWQQNALLQLRGPGDSSAASKQQQQQQQEALPDLRQLLGPPDEPAQVHGSSSADAALQQQQQQQQVQQQQMQQLPDVNELTGLVFANCTGEEFEDPALVLLRGATSCGHLGVWPAAALINHACAPNCHAMLLGDRLVVRAARDIPAATELSLSYLGPQLFAPAAERQAELQQQWGFDCGCSRCKAEARYSSSSSGGGSKSLLAALQHTYSRCQELSPQLDAAVDAEDLQAVRSVQQELLALQESVEGGIRAAKPPANVRRWLQASVYDLYDLLSLAADQLPPPPPKSAGRGGQGGRGGSRGRGSSGGRSAGGPAVETEALATCARIVGELTPGSSAHVELAVEYMVRTEARFGGGHQESDDASRLCAAAITTRYAPISNSMLQLLMDTWAGAALL